MKSYINYYNVMPGTEKYNLIAQDVIAMLKVITGADDLDTADLSREGARNYLIGGGMKAEQIDTLVNKLSTPIPVSGTRDSKAVSFSTIEFRWSKAPAIDFVS